MNRRKQPPPLSYPGDPQRDLVTEAGHTCPTCGGAWPRRLSVRVCRCCGQPIRRGEKWRTVPAGPGLFAYQHREPCGVDSSLRGAQDSAQYKPARS